MVLEMLNLMTYLEIMVVKNKARKKSALYTKL